MSREESHTEAAPHGEPSEGWSPSAGEVIAGRYRLVRPIGRGGMGEVWLAEHEALRSEVALKFLTIGVDDGPVRAAALARFRFEAQVSARLSGVTPHIVTVHDAGAHDGAPYLAMELVRGHTLEDEIGRMTPERFAIVLGQLADALTAAHERGIVHRDIKPANVMVLDGEPLRVKLADFGVAKAMGGPAAATDGGLDRPKTTAAGALVGSPGYMSPEQLRGSDGVDRRTDVWALGVVAYEVLTGVPAFDGTIADIIVAISTREPQKMSELRPLPRSLDAWLARALAKEPLQRFASVRELAQAFSTALSEPDGDGAAVPVAPGEADGSGKRRGASTAVAIAIAAVAVAVVAWVTLGRSPAPDVPPRAAELPVAPLPTAAPVTVETPAPSASPFPTPAPPTVEVEPKAVPKEPVGARPAGAPTSKPSASARPRKEFDRSEIQ